MACLNAQPSTQTKLLPLAPHPPSNTHSHYHCNLNCSCAPAWAFPQKKKRNSRMRPSLRLGIALLRSELRPINCFRVCGRPQRKRNAGRKKQRLEGNSPTNTSNAQRHGSEPRPTNDGAKLAFIELLIFSAEVLQRHDFSKTGNLLC